MMADKVVEAIADLIEAEDPIFGYTKDTREEAVGNAQAALAAYHAHLAEQGLVIVPEKAFEIGALADIIHDNYDGSPAEIAMAVHTAMIQAAKER